MRVALPLAAALPALVAARPAVTPTMFGGWHAATVTDVHTQLLNDALSGRSYAAKVGATRVCYADVLSLETQLVSGTNYRFHISGCDVTRSVGACAASTLSTCAPSEFLVEVYEEPWTETLKVTGIAPWTKDDETSGGDVDGEVDSVDVEPIGPVVGKLEAETASSSLDEGEKAAVDAWIAAEKLNEFGDDPTTVYMGGTPLFDESTGTTRDLYDYVLRRHPDRPWQSRPAATTTTSFAATKAGEDATLVRGSVAAVLSVLIVVLVGVAVVKVRRERSDRFPYNPIHSR